MKQRRIILLVLLSLCCTQQGCLPDEINKQKKWTLDPAESKLSYGNYLATSSLKYFFPDAQIEVLPHAFSYTSMDVKMKYNFTGRSLLVLEGLDFRVSDDEWKALKTFVSNGNEVVLFCSRLDGKIEQELNCNKEYVDEEERRYLDSVPAAEHTEVLTLNDDPAKHFGYCGRSIRGYFDVASDSDVSDTSTTEDFPRPDTLGYANEQPDLLRYALGKGHITLHAAPLVLSNYFLLQDNNEQYLAGIWHTLPANINHIYWNRYFRRSGSASGYGALLKYPAAKLALLLALATLLAYVLFEGKRKQRIIPYIAPLKNESVSFVETVGRLYYNESNHANLAAKMTNQFLEWVRTHYFLNTNLLNNDFVAQLVLKSGQPEATVRGLMDMIHEIRMNTALVDDAYLYQLYNTIQLFYKNTQDNGRK